MLTSLELTWLQALVRQYFFLRQLLDRRLSRRAIGAHLEQKTEQRTKAKKEHIFAFNIR